MTWIALLLITVVALGIVPLLLLASTAELRARGTRQYSRLGEYWYSANLAQSPRAVFTGHVFSARSDLESRDPVHGRESAVRTVFARAPYQFVCETVCDESVFEYSIHRESGTVRQAVPDQGGFSEIVLRLYDRVGNSFTVPRRLSNN